MNRCTTFPLRPPAPDGRDDAAGWIRNGRIFLPTFRTYGTIVEAPSSYNTLPGFLQILIQYLKYFPRTDNLRTFPEVKFHSYAKIVVKKT